MPKLDGQIVAECRRGPLQVTIWQNEGDKGAYYSATLKRSYRDQEGGWQDTKISLPLRDLLQMARMLEWANDRVFAEIAAAREADTAASDDAPY